MLQFNRFQLNVEFCRSTQECHVCCQELPGDEFFRLTECQHHFCHDCMTSYCKHHVSVGTVEKLRCPDTECDSVIPPHIVQSVLPADAFDRWERLMLQKTLENMTDMDWCPRCNNPVIREAEEDLNLGHCTTCIFSFCTLCRNPWHQGESCPEIEKQLAAEMRKNMSSTEKEKFEEKKKKLDEEIRSLISLQKETKLCPKCKVKIDKDGGCNMMRCRCGALFDWLVGLPTSNFNTGSCHKPDMRVLTPLVGDITPRNVDHVQRLLYGKQRDKANTPDDLEKASCPVCRYKNVKAGRNNHIKCQVCKTNYCFVCREKIVGVVTAHFTPGACPQHS